MGEKKTLNLPLIGNIILTKGHSVLGIILGIIAGGILILISGVNPFDAYGAISDYARAREISERGRELMSAALDEYEALRTIPGRDRL